MRRQFAGPQSSNYKEKDHKISPAIDPGLIKGKVSYLKIEQQNIENNPTGSHKK